MQIKFAHEINIVLLLKRAKLLDTILCIADTRRLNCSLTHKRMYVREILAFKCGLRRFMCMLESISI